jgi:hypothetical protein
MRSSRTIPCSASRATAERVEILAKVKLSAMFSAKNSSTRRAQGAVHVDRVPIQALRKMAALDRVHRAQSLLLVDRAPHLTSFGHLTLTAELFMLGLPLAAVIAGLFQLMLRDSAYANFRVREHENTDRGAVGLATASSMDVWTKSARHHLLSSRPWRQIIGAKSATMLDAEIPREHARGLGAGK